MLTIPAIAVIVIWSGFAMYAGRRFGNLTGDEAERRLEEAIGEMRFGELIRSGLALAMVALFLAGSAGEAAGLHRCPHHDTVAGHAGHPDASHGEVDGGHGCTCFGTCHGSAAVALPAGLGDAHVSAHAIRHDRPRAISTPAAQASPYLHPFANGPPTP